MKRPKAPLQFPAYVPDGARTYLGQQHKTARGRRRALIEKLALRLPKDVYGINATERTPLDRGWWGTIALPAIVRLAEHSPRKSRERARKLNDKMHKAAKLANELANTLDALDTKDSPIAWIVRDRIIMRWKLLRAHPTIKQRTLSAALRECARDLTDAKPDITLPREAATASRKAHQIQDLLRGLYTVFVDGFRYRKATRDVRRAMRIIGDLILHDGTQRIDNEAVERACAAMRGYFRKTSP
jgi:hypothetical protein